jgi:hypothetical protein
MCLSASQSDSLVITEQDLYRANALITALEDQMPKVYNKVGLSEDSAFATKVLAWLDRNNGSGAFRALYGEMYAYYPDSVKFERLLKSLVNSGQIRLDTVSGMVTKS